ncbi:MAG: hypothetical protein RML95_15865, partial [Anaerolineae bacterium]|nr:hypothetical protein [Anaerolineae bacterium]
MQVRQKLTEFESTIAFVIGGGLILLMLVFGLAAASGGADVSRLNLFLLLGALLLFVGIAVWLFTSRPWRTHDDWSEPLYTGHEHDDHHAEPHVQHAEAPVETLAHASAAESAELAAAANIPPSIAAVLEAAETVTAAPDQPVEQAEPQTVVSEEPQSVYAAVEPPAYAQIPEARALNQVAEPVE